MYILIYLRILKLYYHILDKGDGRSGKESLLLNLKQVIVKQWSNPEHQSGSKYLLTPTSIKLLNEYN